MVNRAGHEPEPAIVWSRFPSSRSALLAPVPGGRVGTARVRFDRISCLTRAGRPRYRRVC